MDAADALRSLPRTDALLADPALQGWPRNLAREAVRTVLHRIREAVRGGAPVPDDVVAGVVTLLRAWTTPRLVGVVNATGVVLHTNLGRAPWSAEAIAAASDAARGYTNLELRLGDGSRGGRLDGVRERLTRLTGAEDALVVNNNAAAVLLALTAFARDREVIVSRGELVEIGGSFRVPDVVASGGARLVAVGTTNRTRASDVSSAIGPHTAVLLKVHPSNFRIEGFTAEVGTPELVALADAHGLVVVHDLGSGALRPRGDEPDVRSAVAQGAHLVTFSGDKLLGGPQAGIVVGRADAVQRLRDHPLYRALRVGKSVLAGLDATLIGHLLERPTPVDAMLDADPAVLERRTERVCEALRARGVRVERVDVQGRAGGGAMPGEALAGPGLAVSAPSVERAARALRTGTPAVLVRVRDDRLQVDLRTVDQAQEDALITRLATVVGSG